MRTMTFSLLALLLCSLHGAAQTVDFECQRAKAACVAQWDADGDGELSFEELAAVTTLDKALSRNKRITSFDELSYFTSLRTIGPQAFFDDFQLRHVTIPPSVDTIGEAAFWSCIRLDDITIPKTVKVLRRNCFYHCTKLQRVEIPSSIDTIPQRAFMWCEALREVNVCNGVRVIEAEAFAQCQKMEHVLLPASLTFIGNDAFGIPCSVRQIQVSATTPPAVSGKPFSTYVLQNATLLVPEGTLDAYRQAPGWCDFIYVCEMF